MSLKKLGRYDLIKVLGKGAMGLVYEGRDPNLDRRVAIKTIKVENLSDEAADEYEIRFRTEARSAARLQHPNIVSVYDSDRDIDIAYLVMEFIQGEDLKHHLDQGKLYTLKQTLDIMADLLSALDYAHKQSIVHRDIKPANLLIEASGRVKLTDFGVARIQDSGEATRTQGSIVGTLKYMSPEQVQGRPVDARADIFAAGIVLYQLLTGKRPFDADSDFATIQQIVTHHPAPPTSFNNKLPRGIDAVMEKVLAKDRDKRYASAGEFASALKEATYYAEDPTVVPPLASAKPGRNATWTGTVQAGEGLVGLQSGTGSGVSTVTQELELVYWKDIKDSVDADDIHLFISKFPDGVYADLARRRLKKLGFAAGEDSGTNTNTVLMSPNGRQEEKTVAMPGGNPAVPFTTTIPAIGRKNQGGISADTAWKELEQAAAMSAPAIKPRPVASRAAATGDEATLLMGGPADADAAGAFAGLDTGSGYSFDSGTGTGSSVTQGPAHEAAKLSEPSPVEPAASKAAAPGAAAVSATPASKTGPKPAMLAGIGVAVLVIAGGIFKMMSGGTPATALPADAPAAAVATAPSASMPASAAVIAAAAPVSASTAVVAALPAAAASAPLSPASKAAAASAATAKKLAADKDKQAKLAQAKASAPVVAAPTAPKPSAVKAHEESAAAAATATGSASDPRTACENRMLLGFQICMQEQCAKPAFTNHPTCVQRRAMEQKRKDDEQLRR